MFKYISDKTILTQVFQTYNEQQASTAKRIIAKALSTLTLTETPAATASVITANDDAMKKLKTNLSLLFLNEAKLINALSQLSSGEAITINQVWSDASSVLNNSDKTDAEKEKLKNLQTKLSEALATETSPSIDEFKRSVIKAKLAALHSDDEETIPDNVTYLDKVV